MGRHPWLPRISPANSLSFPPMGFLSRLFGNREQPPAGQFPRRIEIVPGALSITASLVDAQNGDRRIPCWCLASDGLRAHGQQEIVLVLTRQPGDDFERLVRDAANYFKIVRDFAAKGQLVHVLGFTQFGGPGFLAGPTVRGITYTNLPVIEGVDLPRDSLLAVLLLGEEIEAVRGLGAPRVLARIGQHFRYYPWPYWSDRGRPAVGADAGDEGSILARVGSATQPGFHARADGTTLVFRIRPGVGQKLAEKLEKAPADAVIALIPELDLAGDGLLVWRQGQKGPAAITPEGSSGRKLSLCFVGLLRDQPEDGGQLVEDGAAMKFTNESWKRFLAALRDGTALTFAATGEGLRLSLLPVDAEIKSAVDGSTMRATGGWTSYEPEHPAEIPPDGVLRTSRVVLLTEENELARRVDVEALAHYLNALEAAARDRLGRGLERGHAALRVTLEPGKAPAFAAKCDDVISLEALQAVLPGVPAPPVKGSVQVELGLDTHA